MKNLYYQIFVLTGITMYCPGFSEKISGKDLPGHVSESFIQTGANTLAGNIPAVTFTPDTIDGSGSTTISISIDNPDNLEYGYYYIYNPLNQAGSYNYIDPNDISGGNYYHDFAIDAFDLPGYWYIGDLNLTNNGVLYSYNAETLNSGFMVINTSADTMPPVLRNFSLSTDTAYAKDTVIISMQIFDSLSGISNLNVYALDEAYNYYFISDNIFQGENLKNLEFKYIIKKYENPGLRAIIVQGSDIKGNYFSNLSDTIYYPLVVLGTVRDTIGPKIHSAKITGNQLGKEAILELIITDENSGLSDLSCNMNSSNYDIYLNSENFIKLNDSLFRCDLIKLRPYFPSGNYSLEIYAADSAYNSSYFYPELLRINNQNSDNSAPVIISAEFDKDTLFPGDAITLQIHLSDDKSGIQYFNYTIANTLDSRNSISESISLPENNLKDYTFSKTIHLSDFGPLGNWYLEELYVNDFAERSNRLTGDTPVFFYYPRYKDDIPPVFENISFVPTEVNAGDTVTAILMASDDYSGIKEVELYLYNSVITLNFDNKIWTKVNEQRYELKIPINKYVRPGILNYYLSSISDLAGNVPYNMNENGKAFKVLNEIAFDIIPPVFDSLIFSKEIVFENDTQNFIFYMHDNLSGIDPGSLIALFGPTVDPDEMAIAIFPQKTGNNTYGFSLSGKQMLPGEYSLNELIIRDSVGNSFQHNDDFGKEYIFEVANDHGRDTVDPEFISYHVFPEIVQPGDTVYVEVKTMDEGYGVLGIYVFLQNSLGADVTQIGWNDWSGIQVSDTFIFSTTYIVPQSAMNGTWVFGNTGIIDKALNDVMLNYGSDYNNASFEVTGGQSFPNRPPRWILNDINLTVEPGSSLEYIIPAYLVADIDGNEITFTATMKNGGNLEPWITFSPENLKVALNPGPDDKGNYTVWIIATDPEGLHEELRVNVKVALPTGIPSLTSENLSVYPNPATDKVFIDHHSNIVSVALYDITGKLRLNTTLASGEMDVSDLERGLYFMRIETDKMTIIRKITLISGH